MVRSSYAKPFKDIFGERSQEEAPGVRNLFENQQIAIVPIRYGDEQCGFFVSCFKDPKFQGNLLNAGNLVASAMSEALARIRRVNRDSQD